MKKAIFYDRDGVINHSILKAGKPYPPRSLNELTLVEHVEEVLRLAHEHQFLNIIVTNQPDVARNITPRDFVESIHQRIQNILPVDDIKTCFHDDDDHCQCRKPKPGMLLQSSKEFNINLQASYLIGDRAKDIEAGRSAGCKTIFLDWGYGGDILECDPTYKTNNLKDAMLWILADSSAHEFKKN